MKALIFENKVVDVATTEFEVHESMTWRDCPDDCKAGEWEVVSGVLHPITIPVYVHTYAENRKAKYDALSQFEMQYDDLENNTTTWVDAINAIKAEYPKP